MQQWSDKAVMRLLLSLGLVAASLPVAAPAQERVLTVFGSDECPAATICVRAPEKERFRIPKELRKQTELSPTQRSWASRVSSTMDQGRTGPSACAAASGGSWVGCFGEEMRQAREEARLAAEGGTDASAAKPVRLISTP
jgi:hypothetical protein